MKKAKGGEPRYPEDNFVEILDIYDSKHEDELVEDEIPKFVFHVLWK
jgi:hypothetical protein